MPAEALRQALGVPDRQLLPALVRQAGAVSNDGRIARPGQPISLGAAERSVAAVESRLAKTPFAAPDLNELAELRLGHRELAAAERAGRLLRVTEDVVLLPDAPQRAIRRLAELAAAVHVERGTAGAGHHPPGCRAAAGISRRPTAGRSGWTPAGAGWFHRADSDRGATRQPISFERSAVPAAAARCTSDPGPTAGRHGRCRTGCRPRRRAARRHWPRRSADPGRRTGCRARRPR